MSKRGQSRRKHDEHGGSEDSQGSCSLAKAMQLAQDIYALTARYPKEELYGLTLQTRRASVSVPSNIAEGAARKSTREFKQFLRISLGSVAELETQLLLAHGLRFIREPEILTRVEEIRKMLLGLLRSLRQKTTIPCATDNAHHSSLI